MRKALVRTLIVAWVLALAYAHRDALVSAATWPLRALGWEVRMELSVEVVRGTGERSAGDRAAALAERREDAPR
jgi:hypothetical protein